MNNKGFTLIELLAVLVLVSFASIFVVNYVHSTLSIGKDESYQIMQKNIISSSYDYINECNAAVIDCDFSLDDEIEFKASILRDMGYFKNLNSPIDGRDLGECLVVKARREQGAISVDLIDLCY